MGIIEQAKLDVQDITSNLDGFGVTLTLTAPTSETIDVVGLHTKHHLSLDFETGRALNSTNAHCSFSETELIDLGFISIRNSKGEVDLKGYKVDIKDSTGTLKNYVIKEWFPDETVGLIVCILGQYE